MLQDRLLDLGIDLSLPSTGHTGSTVRLPLHYFDNTDYERHAPEEWIALDVLRDGRLLAALLVPLL